MRETVIVKMICDGCLCFRVSGERIEGDQSVRGEWEQMDDQMQMGVSNGALRPWKA